MRKQTRSIAKIETVKANTATKVETTIDFDVDALFAESEAITTGWQKISLPEGEHELTFINIERVIKRDCNPTKNIWPTESYVVTAKTGKEQQIKFYDNITLNPTKIHDKSGNVMFKVVKPIVLGKILNLANQFELYGQVVTPEYLEEINTNTGSKMVVTISKDGAYLQHDYLVTKDI